MSEPTKSSSSPSLAPLLPQGGAGDQQPFGPHRRSVSRANSTVDGEMGPNGSSVPSSSSGTTLGAVGIGTNPILGGNTRIVSTGGAAVVDGDAIMMNSSSSRATEIPPDTEGQENNGVSSTPSGCMNSLAISDEATTNSGAAVVEATVTQSGPMDVSTSVSQDGRGDSSSPAANVDDEDDEEGGGGGPTGQQDDDDESDYSYTYEDDDDNHFTGFLVPSEDPHAPSASGDSGVAKASAAVEEEEDMGDANVIDCQSESGEGAGGGDPSSSSSSPKVESEPEDEPATAAAASSSSATATTARKSKWREPSQQAVSMSLRAEKERTGGKRRLAADLYKVMMGDTTEQGFSMEPAQEDCMDLWRIKLFGFDEDSNLSKDMAVLGLEHIELEMSFPDQYPFEPPFVRVVRPRFKRQTGFVMNGALCMELLTNDGWNPINDIESVIVSIRSLLVVGDGRLAAAANLVTDKKKKPVAAAAAAAKPAAKKRGGAGDDDEHDPMEEDDPVLARGGKRQRAAGGAAAYAAAAGFDGDADMSDNHSDSDGDDGDADASSSNNKARKGKKKRSSSKISASTAGTYTAAEARAAYSHLSDYHKKKGWDASGWWARKG